MTIPRKFLYEDLPEPESLLFHLAIAISNQVRRAYKKPYRGKIAEILATLGWVTVRIMATVAVSRGEL